MTSTKPAEQSRFDVLRVLGVGGMACVYEVFDRALQRRVALKRLQKSGVESRKRRMVELFESEFYTLSQLAHPAIVQVFDYGVDEAGPYYTMELLEGGELQTLAPLPYKQTCLLARDICSALSLLHSRRLLHRDINPRNVHCNEQGTPKLIDFGAIAPMGSCTNVVGTPAYCAPEALELGLLDARTDLFSLGASLYYALTGQHAFPAKTFEQVRRLWDLPPTRPSAYVPDLPAALDSLIMDLLKLDPAARPAHAGELMEQFAAIAGQTIDEHAGVSQAYLSTPSMVGREPQLAVLRSQLKRAALGQGSGVFVTSASGAGRSRFLAACQLEATMAGALVVHATSTDVTGEYGVVRALGHRLLDIAPELARRAAREAGEILGQLLQLGGSPAASEPQAESAAELPRPQVLAAIRAWFTAVARERTLLLAIDDHHRTDEPSAACFAWLAPVCHEHAMLLVASSDAEASATAPAAVKLYESSATRIALENLSELQTVELLRSVFGSVPHVQALGHKLYEIAAGNPRDTLRLAQTLVDLGAAKYRSGAWSLPASFSASWMPQSMQQAIVRELEALDPVARDLACVLALANDRALSFEECTLACGDGPTKSAHDALQQLLRVEFTKLEAGRYTIAHRGLNSALTGVIAPDEFRVFHGRLAVIFARRDDEVFRQAKHLLLSGDAERGVDALVAFAVTTQARTDRDPEKYVQLVMSMPEDWFGVFDAAIDACKRLGRSRGDLFRLRIRLASLLNVMGVPSHIHLLALIRQLCQDSGLDSYVGLDPAMDRAERLQQALGEVKRRYETSSEQERGLEPGLAIRSLVRALMLASGMVALGLDYLLWQALPSIAPLEPLSPAFGLIERLVGAVAARVAGRHEYARVVYTAILERLDHPDLAGLDASNHRFMRFGVMYGVALIEAGMGLRSSLRWAQALASEPLHSVNALQVRMVHELWLGRVLEADHVRELAELRRIESGTRQMADGTHLVWQMLAHAYSDDLMRLKQVLEELRPLAQRHVGWTAVVNYALAEHQRIRGDHTRALKHLNTALAQLTAGTHQIWPHAAAAQVSLLCTQERFELAAQYGQSYLEEAERAELGYLANYIRMPLAIVYARLGQHARALALSREALQVFQALGTAGVNLVLVYETCSRVARYAGQLDDCQRFAVQCAQACADMSGQALRARSERLMRGTNMGAQAALGPERFDTSAIETTLKSAFRDCDKPSLRALRALQLLLSHSGARAGLLYLIGERGLVLTAQIDEQPTAELTTIALKLFDTEVRRRDLVTVSMEAESGTSEMSSVVGNHALVPLCHQTIDGVVVTGVAALETAPGLPFMHPGALAARLSRMLAEAGDVVPACPS